MRVEHLAPVVWRALEALTDLAVVLDDQAVIEHVNPYGCRLLDVDLGAVRGTSIVDHLHPDDLARAALVLGRIAGETLGVPVTPAMYRVRRRDGTWIRIELNGTVATDDDGRSHLIVFGRYSGDHDLQDRMLELLTAGAPTEDAVALVPELGLWRHRGIDYAVLFIDDQGQPCGVGSTTLLGLGSLTDPDSPWAAAADGVEQRVELAGREEPWAARARAAGLSDLWALPVADPLHDRHAVVAFGRRPDGPAVDVHAYAMEIMAKALGLVLQWRHQVIGLQRAARVDPLTAVANRAGFWDRLSGLDGDAHDVAMLYIDLDGFKSVNDRHGHAVGDQVLAEVGRRLVAAVRPDDLVARLGGDEFAVVIRRVHRDEDATTIADRIVASIGAPFAVEGTIEGAGAAAPDQPSTVRLGASVGIARVTTPGFDPDALLDAADRALYEAKRSGRGRWHLADTAG